MLRNNHIVTKVIISSLSTSKLMIMLPATFDVLDFADVSSYFTFKLSVWKRGCTTSFELQMSPTSPTPSSKALTKFYQVKHKLQPSNGPHNFYGLLNFSNILSFKLL